MVFSAAPVRIVQATEKKRLADAAYKMTFVPEYKFLLDELHLRAYKLLNDSLAEVGPRSATPEGSARLPYEIYTPCSPTARSCSMPLPDHIRKQIEQGKAAFEANLKGEPIPGLDVPVQDARSRPLLNPGGGASGRRGTPSTSQSKSRPTPLQRAPRTNQPLSTGARGRRRAGSGQARYRHLEGPGQAATAEQLKLAKQTRAADRDHHCPVQRHRQAAGADGRSRKPPAVSPAVDTSPKSLVTPEEREQYGDEFSNYIERLAQQKADQQLKQFAAQIDDRLKDR